MSALQKTYILEHSGDDWDEYTTKFINNYTSPEQFYVCHKILYLIPNLEEFEYPPYIKLTIIDEPQEGFQQLKVYPYRRMVEISKFSLNISPWQLQLLRTIINKHPQIYIKVEKYELPTIPSRTGNSI